MLSRELEARTALNLSVPRSDQRSAYAYLFSVLGGNLNNMAAETPGSPEDYSLFLSENGHLSFENPNYQAERSIESVTTILWRIFFVGLDITSSQQNFKLDQIKL